MRWCRGQDYETVVGDDWAEVDLDWWNHRLADRAIPARVYGRDLDGAPAWTGIGYLRRGDLSTDTPTDHGPTDLNVLYRAAAWLSGHRDRDRARRFPDVRTTGTPGHEYDVITTALTAMRQPHPLSAPPAVSDRLWSGWPRTPGVGPAVLSLYQWATHHSTTVRNGGVVVGPQLLDTQTVASLIHLGWLENPAADRFTWTRYTRYCALLHAWATQGDVAAELIEMWLVTRWRDRTAVASHTEQHRR